MKKFLQELLEEISKEISRRIPGGICGELPEILGKSPLQIHGRLSEEKSEKITVKNL